MKVKINTDGGARGNPGPAASGFVIKDEAGQVLAKGSTYLGATTNNQAEYHGVVSALRKARELGATEVEVFMDSELAVKQLRGEYKVKNSDLAKRYLEVWNLLPVFKQVIFTHVRREKNKEADALVNKCLDENRPRV